MRGEMQWCHQPGHNEQVKQRHDGYIVDLGRVGSQDRREVLVLEVSMSTLNAVVAGDPAGKTIKYDLVCRLAGYRGSGSIGDLRSPWFLLSFDIAGEEYVS